MNSRTASLMLADLEVLKGIESCVVILGSAGVLDSPLLGRGWNGVNEVYLRSPLIVVHNRIRYSHLPGVHFTSTHPRRVSHRTSTALPGTASAMAYKMEPPSYYDSSNRSPLQLTLVILVLSALFILYGYLLWTRPLAKYRTASKIRTYLQSKEDTPFYSTSAAYSTQRAVNTFAHFQELSEQIIDSHRRSYKKLSPRQKTLGEAIGYPKKLRDMEDGNRMNSSFARKVARFAEREFKVAPGSSKDTDVYRGREALKHLVRDWSDEGLEERKTTQTPILEALDALLPLEKRADARVLVPGCGLGRLAWEISRLGE